MESETHAELLAVLRKFGIQFDSEKIIGQWNLIGHLMDVCVKHEGREATRKAEIVPRRIANGVEEMKLSRNMPGQDGGDYDKALDDVINALRNSTL